MALHVSKMGWRSRFCSFKYSFCWSPLQKTHQLWWVRGFCVESLICTEESSALRACTWRRSGNVLHLKPSLPRRPMASSGALRGGWAAGQGRFSSPSALPWWGPICTTVSSAGLPSSRKMRSYWRESSRGLQGWRGDWSIPPTRKGWGSWACLAWRREGWEGTL